MKNILKTTLCVSGGEGSFCKLGYQRYFHWLCQYTAKFQRHGIPQTNILGFLLYLTNTATLWYMNWIINFWYFLKNRLIWFRVPLDFGVTAVTYKDTNLKYLEIVFIMDWIPLLIYHGKDITNSQHFQNISINASPNFPNGTIEKLPVVHNFWCPPSYVGFLMSLVFIFTNIAIISWQKFMWYKN